MVGLSQELDQHEIFTERMSLALDGLLDDREQADFDEHLASCDQCRARWMKWQRISDVLWYEPYAGPPRSFVFDVDHLVQHEQRRRERMLGGLVLVGGTISVWTVAALSMAVAIAVWLSVTPGARWQIAEYLGFGTQVVALVTSNLGALRDGLLASMPSPAVPLLGLVVIAALAIVWARLVFWSGPVRSAAVAGDNGRNLK